MRVVITGALGHIGSRLIRELPRALAEPEVVMVDDLSAQRYCSLFDLPAGVSYRFVETDVVTTDLRPLVAGADAVVHLAAITNAAGSFQIKDDVERVNFLGAERVAEACAASGVPLVFISTTSVYGTQREVVDEDCPPGHLRPQSPYAESKLRAERRLAELGVAAGLPFVVCRFGTIVGTSIGMRFHTAVNKFCWQAVMGQPLTVWRTAMHQQRPYLDLEDAVRALCFILETRCFDGRVYNVLTTNATVAEIVEEIRGHLPGVKVELVDAEVMNQLSYTVSDARVRARGFRPTGSLPRAIARTLWLLGLSNGMSVQAP